MPASERRPATLAEAFSRFAADEPEAPAWTLYASDRVQTWTRGQVGDEVARRVRALRAQGVEPGEPVLLTWPTGIEFVASFWACLLAGNPAVPVPLAPGPRAASATEERLRGILARHDVRWAMAPPGHAEAIGRAASHEVTVVGEAAPGSALGSLPPRAESPALIQFTSGSTLDPRGCVVSERALLANAEATIEATGLRRHRAAAGVNWCPLYHDMGLISAVVVPVVARSLHVVLLPPERFMARPSRWLELLSRHAAVITVATNSALALVARWAERRRTAYDLGSLELIVTGAEPIDPAVVRRFEGALSGSRLRPGTVCPAYGLAEATLAVTVRERGMRTVRVGRARLERDALAAAPEDSRDPVELVSLGRPIPGVDVRVVDGEGMPRPPGGVGEIEVASAARCDGYLDDVEATATLFHDGWLRTGDRGFLDDGELVLVGRIKESIIVGGRNVSPTDIERVVEGLPSWRVSASAAFASRRARGDDGVVLVLEGTGADPAAAVASARDVVQRRLGIALANVVTVPRGTIPRTTSGKVRRQRCRELYDAGALGGRRPLGEPSAM